ncbi:MAG: sugar phosphate isomerase/epimerase family protein [Planctomycetota bacterium]
MLEKARELRVHLVQIADNLPLHEMPERDVIHLRDLSLEYGISLETGTRGVSEDHIKKYTEISTFLNSSILRCVIDTPELEPTPDETIALVEKLIPHLETADVKLAIENHDRFTVNTLNYILRRLESNHVGICFDTANSFGCLEGPNELLGKLGRRIINVHIKDVSVERLPHNYGFTIKGAPAGFGQLDIGAIIDGIRSIGSDPNMILELWTPPEQNVNQTARKEDEWVRRSIHYLRQYIKQ